MINPVPLYSLLHRTDITRVHYTPCQLPPRHLNDGLALMAHALAYLPVSVVRTERGVPTRVLRTLKPEEVGRHGLVPDLTAYAWSFEHREAGQASVTFMIVVAQSEVRAPDPGEAFEFWGRHGLIRGGRQIYTRNDPPKRPAEPSPAAASPSPRKTKLPQIQRDLCTGEKGSKAR